LLKSEIPLPELPYRGEASGSAVLSGLVVLFLIPDGIIKFIKPAPVVDAFAHLGWPLSLANVIGSFCSFA